MTPRKLHIEEWQNPSTTKVADSRAAPWLPNTRILGVLGTLLLHISVGQSVLLGSRAQSFRPPDNIDLGAARLNSTMASSKKLILLKLPSAPLSDTPVVDASASLGALSTVPAAALLNSSSLRHLNIPASEISDDSKSEAAIDSGDTSKRVALFGKYTGQIDARIERAWRRPRSPVNPALAALHGSPPSAAHGIASDDTFTCRIRILQDDHGSVQDVQMVRCNGSAAWQQSIVFAIRSVSPLPAPPDPTVFTHAITMTFTANPYTQGSAADDYERETTATAHMADREAAPVSQYSRKAHPAGILFSHPTQ